MNKELEAFFYRMYADLVISTDEAEATNHKYLTLEEIFKNAPLIKQALHQPTLEELKQSIIDELEKKYRKAYFREIKGLFDYEGMVTKITLTVVQFNFHYTIMIYDKINKETKIEHNPTISAKALALLGEYFIRSEKDE